MVKQGAKLDLGLDKPGWVPISKLDKPGGGFIKKVSEVVKVGDQIRVMIRKVKDREARRTTWLEHVRTNL